MIFAAVTVLPLGVALWWSRTTWTVSAASPSEHRQNYQQLLFAEDDDIGGGGGGGGGGFGGGGGTATTSIRSLLHSANCVSSMENPSSLVNALRWALLEQHSSLLHDVEQENAYIYANHVISAVIKRSVQNLYNSHKQTLTAVHYVSYDNSTVTSSQQSGNATIVENRTLANYWRRIDDKYANEEVMLSKWPLTIMANCYTVHVVYPHSSHVVDSNPRKTGAWLVLEVPSSNIDYNQCSINERHRNDADAHHLCGDQRYSKCISMKGGGFRLGKYRCCCITDEAPGVCLDGAILEASLMNESSSRIGANNNATHMCLIETPIDRLSAAFVVTNLVCTTISIVMLILIARQRKQQQLIGSGAIRGWALMELFCFGSTLMYLIIVADFVQPSSTSCCVSVWLRECGFALFYGSIVLKIYRNLVEYRVRKAHHVYVKELDLLKYLGCMCALTVTGLLAWTLGTMQTSESPPNSPFLTSSPFNYTAVPYPPLCRFHYWTIAWQLYELIFLLWGARLCYKARNSSWSERWNYTIAVGIEIVASLAATSARYIMHKSKTADTSSLLIVTFVHSQLTVTAVVLLILAPKFYYVSRRTAQRSETVSGASGRAHPSLAKLRDNLINGTIDFAEVPIVDMNPEDIRAELKRVYTQLRMFKLKGQYQDNPHIVSRRKKNKSDRKDERQAIGRATTAAGATTKAASTCSPLIAHKQRGNELYRVEEDESSSMMEPMSHSAVISSGTGPSSGPMVSSLAKSFRRQIDDDGPSVVSLAADTTVESSPHNVYLSKDAVAATQKYQLESHQSVRI